jgi:hypothetical protein
MPNNQHFYLQRAEKFTTLAAAAENPLMVSAYSRLASEYKLMARAAGDRIRKFTRSSAAEGDSDT